MDMHRKHLSFLIANMLCYSYITDSMQVVLLKYKRKETLDTKSWFWFSHLWFLSVFHWYTVNFC